MEEIKQLVYNYAKAIHTQNEKDFKRPHEDTPCIWDFPGYFFVCI